MRRASRLAVALAVACAGCTQLPARSTPGPATIDYGQYARGPVDSFSFSSLYDWDSSSPGHVVVWTSPLQAYRLNLVGPCMALQTTPVIYLSSHGGRVHAHGDAVLAGGDRCPILSIDRLDARAIRAARKAGDGQDD